MKLRYLGTAAAEGWPAVFCHCEACGRARALGGKNIRTRAQAVVDEKLLMDFGPDTYMHTLYGRLDLPSIRAVLVTHAHQDHWYPQELLMRGEPYAHAAMVEPLTVYGCGEVGAAFGWAARQNDSPNFAEAVRFAEVTAFVPFDAEGYRVTPLPARHDRNETCLIYLVARGGRTMLYAHDSGLFPEETWEYLQGARVDMVSFDCTNVLDPDGSYHMGIPAATQARDRLVRQGTCRADGIFVLSHFSHNGKLMHEEIERVAAAAGFLTAWDGFEVTVA